MRGERESREKKRGERDRLKGQAQPPPCNPPAAPRRLDLGTPARESEF